MTSEMIRCDWCAEAGQDRLATRRYGPDDGSGYNVCDECYEELAALDAESDEEVEREQE